MPTNSYSLAKRLVRIRGEILQIHDEYLALDYKNSDPKLIDASVALQGVANQLIYVIRKTSSVEIP
jgi:hypothetical protein